MNPPSIGATESRTHQPLRTDLQHYGLAVLSVAVALGTSLLLQYFHFRDASVSLLLFAVAISSWYGGPGPAVMSVILSIISFYWYFVEPVRTIYIYPSEIPYFVIFAGFAALISSFSKIRRRAEEALREKADLLDLTHDTVFVMDMDGVIKYWNRGAEERYEWTAERAVGRNVHDLLKTVFPGPSEQIRAEVIRTGRWEGELLHTKKDGTQVVAASRWSLQRAKQGAPVAILETNNDITARKRAEEALRRLNRELRALSNCNQTLLRATEELGLLKQICRIVCEEAGYRPVWVSYVEHDEAKSVRPVAWAGTDEAYLDNARISWSEDTDRGRGPTGTAIRSGTTCCIQDFATDSRVAPWRELLLQGGFRSAIALPLKDEHANVFGCLTMHSERPDAFTPEEIRLLEELAGDLAFGIVTLRSRAARQQAEQEVALLSLAVNHVREAALLIDESGDFKYVNEQACHVLGYSRGELLGMGVWDIDPEFPRERWSDHWRDLKAQRSMNFESRHRTRDGRVFPVEISGNYFEYGGRAYALSLVRDITERKRAEEGLRRLNRELRAISNCNQALLRATDEQSLLQEICRIVCDDAGYHVAWVGYAEHDEAKSVRPVAWVGIERGDVAELGVTWADTESGRGPGGTAIRTGKTCWIKDYATDPEVALWKENAFQHGFRSAIGLPLKDESGNPFGSLILYSAQPNAFRPEEIRLLEELAADLAFGIVNLRSRAARERAEQALRQSESYLAESQKLTHTGSWALDLATDQYVYVSEEDFRIWGLDPHQGLPTREAVFQRIHPEDREKVKASLEGSLRGGVDSSDEYRIVLPEGPVKHIHTIRHPVLNSGGDVVKLVGTSVDITERKQAEEALRESETRFRTFVDHAADALFIYDFEQGTIVEVNRQACESLGYARQELIGKAPLGFHLESDRAHVKSVAERAAAGEMVIDTHWHKRKDGTLFSVEVHTSQFWYSGRRFLLKVARDVSERLRAEEERAYLASIVESSHDAIIGRSIEGIIKSWNRGAEKLYGYTAQEAVGQPISLVIPSDRAQEFVCSDRLKQGEPIEEQDTVRVGKDGRRINMSVVISPMKDTAGHVIGAATVARDITDRKRAEEALHESERKYRELVEHANSIILRWTHEGRITFLNEFGLKFFGYSTEEIIGRPVVGTIVPPTERAGRDLRRLMLQICADPAAFEQNINENMRRNGERVTIAWSNKIVWGAQGEVAEILSVGTDITERRRADEALRQSEAYLAESQRLTHTGSWAFDVASNKYVYVSDECFRIFEMDVQEGLPREAISRIIHPEDWDTVKRTFEASLLEKVDTSSEFRVVLPRGTVKYLLAIRHPVVNDAGEVVKLVGTVIDITERKRAEQERGRLYQLEADLAHINRVSMLGELTASIAHEVNQPLSGVVSNGSACLRWLAGDVPNVEEAREAAGRIVRDGKRAGEVIARIRALTKRATTPREKLDLNETIREVLAMVGDEAKKKSVITRTQFADDLSPVSGDRVQLQQVVLNLVMNATEAMSSVSDRARELLITTRNVGSDQVQVTVKDSGPGIDPNTLDKIFDPFYTTKPGGMGMGLSICRSILQAHGGRLWAAAKDGPGTTFHFTLPKCHLGTQTPHNERGVETLEPGLEGTNS